MSRVVKDYMHLTVIFHWEQYSISTSKHSETVSDCTGLQAALYSGCIVYVCASLYEKAISSP